MNPTSSHVGSIEEITLNSRPPPNLPCGDLLGNRDDYHKICVPLFNASISADWELCQAMLNGFQHLDLSGFAITENYDTPLHITASIRSTRSLGIIFLQNMVNRMTKDQLELQNKNCDTALCIAAASGNVRAVDIMLKKNPTLVEIPGSQGMMPLYMASLAGQPDTVRYLYSVSRSMTGDIWTDHNRNLVLQACVEADIFDVALNIMNDHPELPIEGRVLELLARKTYAFDEIKPSFLQRVRCRRKLSEPAQLLRKIWKNILKMPKAAIDDILRGPANVIVKEDGRQMSKYSAQILFVAAEMGNVKFLVELIHQYPDLLWKKNDDDQTIFHVAVSHRHEGIYNILYEMSSMRDIITALKDEKGNNMLHLVAKNPMGGLHQELSAVQQMRRELLWFKEVEAIIPLSYRDRKNIDGLTPYELFTKEHEKLFSLSENLIKDTANQCIVAAALIITISFAAAFTVPGGYDQNNGIPLFIHNRYFIVFAISDAISLTLSTIAILKFLSIFVSGCARRDFLLSIYSKLMTGLAILIFSISAMLVGFAFSFFVLYQNKLIWVPIFITALISIPVILFNRFPHDLLLDAYRTTYSTRYLFRPKQPLLYYKNPSF